MTGEELKTTTLKTTAPRILCRTRPSKKIKQEIHLVSLVSSAEAPRPQQSGQVSPNPHPQLRLPLFVANGELGSEPTLEGFDFLPASPASQGLMGRHTRASVFPGGSG